jgi:hypothetical protein
MKCRTGAMFVAAFATGWCVGAVVLIAAASWRMLREFDR